MYSANNVQKTDVHIQKDEHRHLSHITLNFNIDVIKKFNKLKCKQYEKAIHKMRRGISNYTSQVYQETTEICDKNIPVKNRQRIKIDIVLQEAIQSTDVLKLFNTINYKKNWGEPYNGLSRYTCKINGCYGNVRDDTC